MLSLRRHFTSSAVVKSGKFIVRNAAFHELEFAVKLAVSESWDKGPHDLACAYDSKSSFIGELHFDKQRPVKIAYQTCVEYPGHLTFFGDFLVINEYRGRGYGLKITKDVWELRNVSKATHTVGTDALPHMAQKYETEFGVKPEWTNQPALVSLRKVSNIFSKVKISPEILVKPIREVDMDSLCDYDTSVFGAPRHEFLKKWISIPGSLGWAAIDGNSTVVGYCATRQIVCNGGAEIGLNMAPLFADNQLIAKVLLREAANTYLANDAIECTKMLILVPEGENGNASAVKVIENELEAECDCKNTSIRMYTKGAPPNMRIKKIFGLTTLSYG